MGSRAYTHPAALLTAIDLPGAADLTAELDHSVASLALSRAGAAAVVSKTGADAHRSLEYFEQSVIDGHPYHPCCRSRPGFSVTEQLAYTGPNTGRSSASTWLRSRPRTATSSGAGRPDCEDGDTLLLPVHPWQSEHVLTELGHRPAVTAAIPAHPLMSVRTLAPLAGGPHLKTALTMRLTSQIRDISPGSVTNSAPLSALLSNVVERLGGGLWITRNLAAASAVVNGAPSADLAALLREPPDIARLRAGETVMPIAALTARPAGDSPPLIHSLLASAGATDITDWLAAFTGLLLPPLLRLAGLRRSTIDARPEPTGRPRRTRPTPPLRLPRPCRRPRQPRRTDTPRLHGPAPDRPNPRRRPCAPTKHALRPSGRRHTRQPGLRALRRKTRHRDTTVGAAVAAAARRACDEQPTTREGHVPTTKHCSARNCKSKH